jgi:hypothetical protein
MGRTQWKPVPWNRFHKTGNYGFIKNVVAWNWRSYTLERHDCCKTIVSRHNARTSNFKNDFMELASSLHVPPKAAVNVNLY